MHSKSILLAIAGLVWPAHLMADLTFEQTSPRMGVLSWPADRYQDYVLDRATSLSPSVRAWMRHDEVPVLDGDRWRLDVPLTDGERYFRLRYPTRLVRELSPDDGDEMVNVTRHPVVRFDGEIQPDTIGSESLFFRLKDQPVAGTLRVSSTKRFVTFVPAAPFPPSSEVVMVIDGDAILDDDGMPIDGDGDFLPGGVGEYRFRTLPLDRLPNTNVFGFVRDSFSEEPLEGVTIRVDAFPEANAVTDADGRFELVDMPAPDFFVHIDGSTAKRVPAGMSYPVVGKPFHSSPGETIQLKMNGEPFDIYLPPIADADIQTLSPTEVTEVGLGDAGTETLKTMFPELDEATWEGMGLSVPPGSAIDDQGNPVSRAAIIPVPPDRIPAPLPSNLTPSLVVSIQAPGATSFDVPAPVTFPNTDGLEPGARTFITSFDHSAGKWVVTGTATVSADGRLVVSDPGVGILAPGWHGVTNTSDYDLDMRKKPKLTDFQKNVAATGLNAASVVVGAVDIFVPEVAVAPAGNALSVLGASLGTAADNIANDGQLSTGGKTALAVSTAGMLSPEPVSGTFFDVVGLGLAIDSTISSAKAARDSMGSFSDLLNDGPSDWARTIGDITAYAETYGMHYAQFEEGILGLRELMSDTDTPITDPAEVARFLELADLVLEAQDFFETRGGGNVLTAFEKIAEDFQDWMLHFEEMHGAQFETAAHAPFRVTDSEGNEVYRGVTNGEGKARFLLGVGRRYSITVADPINNGLVVIETGVFSGGEERSVLQYITPADGPDSDEDGLIDEVERVLGTDPDNKDSDGDGVGDGTEVQQGFDPLNGRLVATGVISALKLPGAAIDIDVLDETLAAIITERNFVLDGPATLTVLDVSDVLAPVALGEVTLAKNPTAVAGDPELGLVSVVDGSALTIYDMAEPSRPRLLHRFNVDANRVVMADGKVHVIGGAKLTSYASEAGAELASTSLPVEGIDVAFWKNALYVATSDGFSIYRAQPQVDPENGESQHDLLGQWKTDQDDPVLTSGRLFVGGDVVYLATRLGWNAIQVSDPSAPVRLGGPDVQQDLLTDIVVNGSGRLVGTTVFQGEGRLAVYDARELDTVTNLQTQIPTPGGARAVVISNGLAMVADGLRRADFLAGVPFDGSGSLAIINYLPFDNLGMAPSVSLVEPEDGDADRPGVQIEVGQEVLLEARSEDDVQVRVLRLIVDGEVVEQDVRFPWLLPLQVLETGLISVQVEAEDTGGNVSLSEPLAIEVIPDTTAPRLTVRAPADGATRGEDFRSLRFSFSEPVQANSVSAAVRLTSINGGDLIAPADVQLTDGGRTVLLDFPNLPDGTYRIEFVPNEVRDLSGNAPGGPAVVTTFTKSVGGAVWVSATGGSWHEPSNWEGGVLPAEGESVIITIPDGGTVVYSEGVLNLGTLKATQPLVIEGGELDAGSMEVDSLLVRGGVLRVNGELALQEGRLAESGSIEQALISAIGEGAALSAGEGLVSLVNIEIEEGMVLAVQEGSFLTLRDSFSNRGSLRLGAPETAVPVSVTFADIDECACGEILMEGGTSVLGWNNNGDKVFASDTKILMRASNNQISAFGNGPLVFLEGAEIDVMSSGFGLSNVSANGGIILDGAITVGASEFPFTMDPGRNQPLEVRQGSITAGEGALLRLSSPVITGSGSIEVLNAKMLDLEGSWVGAGVVVENTELRLGGDFTLADLGAIERTQAPITVVGRLDFGGAPIGDLEGFKFSGGILANGIVNEAKTFGGEDGSFFIGLEDMRIEAPLSSASQLSIRGDLILNADLLLSTGEAFFPSPVIFESEGSQTVSGNGRILVPPPNEFFPVAIPASIRKMRTGELVFAEGITIEGGVADIANNAGPLILRGTVRAVGDTAVMTLTGNPFTNDGGTIEEIAGGTVVLP